MATRTKKAQGDTPEFEEFEGPGPDDTAEFEEFEGSAQGDTPESKEFEGIAPEGTPSNAALEFARLYVEYRGLKSKTKKIKEQLDQVEDRVLDMFGDLGIRRLGTKDGMTVYLKPELFASVIEDKDGSKEEAHNMFRKHELGYMIKPSVNANVLRAYIAEQKREGNTLPEELLNHIKVTERSRVGVYTG